MRQTKRGPTRNWEGVSAGDRMDCRRRALLESGLTVFGTVGFSASTVAAISAAAGLSNRYFYEHFPDREALLAAVYEEVVAGAQAALRAAFDARPLPESPAAAIRRAIAAYVTYETEDPRRARVQTVEVVGIGPALERRRRDVIHEFADITTAAHLRILRRLGDEAARRVKRSVAVGLIGAANEILIDWALENDAASRTDIADIVDDIAEIVIPALLKS